MKKKQIIFLIVMLMIGFAAVTTSLIINGAIGIGENIPDFDVYFSKAVEDGVENNALIKDKTHIEFTKDMSLIEEKYVLDYEVTNGSKNYDADLTINCVGGNEYLQVENIFDISNPLPAKGKREGKLTITVIQASTEEVPISIVCEIKGNAVERTEIGEEEIEREEPDYLATRYPNTSSGDLTPNVLPKDVMHMRFDKLMYGSKEEYDKEYSNRCSNIDSEECQKFLSNYSQKYNTWMEKNGYNNRPGLWDELDKIIQSSGNWKSAQHLVESIHFDTTKAAPENTLYSWDVSERQNGSIMMHVKDADNNSLYEVYIGQEGGVKANPSCVSLFAYFSNLRSITGLENFDTSDVLLMSSMFESTFYKNSFDNLDLSSWDVSNVIDMGAMFRSYDTQWRYGSLKRLNVKGWDTSNVKSMNGMFSGEQYLSEITGIEEWDLSNVVDMTDMFEIEGENCRSIFNITITISGTKCTNYNDMFSGASTEEGSQITINYTEDASDLVDKMIATKSNNSNVVKGDNISTTQQ